MQQSSRPATGYPLGPGVAANGYPPPPPGTAYSYPNMYYPPQQRNPRAVFLRRLLIFLIGCAIIIGAIFLILVLVLRPRLPTFYLNSLSVSHFNTSGNRVSGDWNLQFQVTNPNKKMSISYDDVYCFVFYDAKFLTQTRIPPFDQGTKVETVLNATLAVVGTYVEGWVSDSINKDRGKGSVPFDVKVVAWVGYRYGAWRGRRRPIVIWCEDALVGLSSRSASGNLVGGARQCSVR